MCPDAAESRLAGVKCINLGLVAEGTKKSVWMLRKSGLAGVDCTYFPNGFMFVYALYSGNDVSDTIEPSGETLKDLQKYP